MEPKWMESIPSSSICNFFYAFFVVYAIIFVLSIIMTITIIVHMRMKGPVGLALGTQAIITTLLGGVMMLFQYLICDRALLKKD